MVTVKNMTTKEKLQTKEVISQFRQEKADIQNLVSETYKEFTEEGPYDEKMMRNYWLLNCIINNNEIAVEEAIKIVGDHSLENTSVEYFKRYAELLNKKILRVLSDSTEVRKFSYATIGKLCLLLEIVNPDFDWTAENMGISGVRLPEVKKVLKIWRKNYYKMVNENDFDEKQFIEILNNLEKKGK